MARDVGEAIDMRAQVGEAVMTSIEKSKPGDSREVSAFGVRYWVNLNP